MMPAACGTDSNSGDNTGTSAAGLSDSFKANCASCHGAMANGGSAPSLRGYSRNKTSFTTQVRNGGGGMPAFTAETYSDANLTVDYTWLISN